MKIQSINSTLSTGMFKNNNSVNFGRQIAGEEFTEAEIAAARKILDGNQKLSAKDYEQSFWDCIEDSKFQPLEWLVLPYTWFLGKIDGDDSDLMDKTRSALGIATIGLTEILKFPEAGIRKLVDKAKVKNFINNANRCALAMIREGKIK